MKVERRQREDRRAAPEGRRKTDYEGRFHLFAFIPALCGALVVVYLFFVAVSGSELAEEPGWAIAALVLALIWLAASWRRLLAGGASPKGDRERRGF
jgi:ATP/ADP translocase